MNPSKPYQLVRAQQQYGSFSYCFTGQTMGFPLPQGTIMIRTVPGHPGTLVELEVSKLELLPNQKRRRWVHYARVQPGPLLPVLPFPLDMLRRERAIPVTFDPMTGEHTEEQFLIAKVGETRQPYWLLERWESFGWTCVHVRSDRITIDGDL